MELDAQHYPNKTAIVTDERRLSWRELDNEVDSAAAFLFKQIGYSESQMVVGLLFPNSWQFIVVYLAILKLGHIALPLDPTYKSIEQEAIVKQMKPVAVITNRLYKKSLGSSAVNILGYEKFPSEHSGQYERLVMPADKQLASLVFTSGTTGKPKAATYSHANHIWNIKTCSEVWRWDKNDTMLLSLPLSHWYGIVMGLAGIIYHGNTLYLQEWFDEELTLKTLASGKISIFTHISTVYSRMLDVGNYYDVSNVRLMISGGSALPPPVWNAFKQRFGQEILECYGSSETGRIASNLLDERIPGSPGRILKDVDLKFSSEGEVLIKSPGVFPGYYKNPSATASSYTKDGYWRTGDIGEIDRGRIILKGRVQERIRRFGYTISPRDVEWALRKNIQISDAYVMGQQSESAPNDWLVYFIVGNLSPDEVRDYCKSNLPYAWRPDEIVMLDSIPRTRNGKPRISELKQMMPAKK